MSSHFSKEPLSGGAVAGIVVGMVLLLTALAILIYFLVATENSGSVALPVGGAAEAATAGSSSSAAAAYMEPTVPDLPSVKKSQNSAVAAVIAAGGNAPSDVSTYQEDFSADKPPAVTPSVPQDLSG